MARDATASRVVESARASEFLCRDAQFGILKQPSVLFSSGEVMNPILRPQRTSRLGARILRLDAKAYTKR
jgi:hypothetical protein